MRSAALAAEMLLWSLLLPGLKRVLPLGRLVRVLSATPERREEASWSTIVQWSATLTRLRPSLRSNCLERSLLAYRFLGRKGADPHLVVAVAQDESGRVVGHAWVTISGRPVHEPSAAVERFAPLVEFYGSGETTGPRAGTPIPTSWA